MKVGHPWCDIWISPGDTYSTVSFEVTFGSAHVAKQVKKSELIAQWKILSAQVEEYLRRWDCQTKLPTVFGLDPGLSLPESPKQSDPPGATYAGGGPQ